MNPEKKDHELDDFPYCHFISTQEAISAILKHRGHF